MSQSPLRLGFLLIPLALACVALSPATQAQLPPPAPDGGYPLWNTADGQYALFSLTTGSNNTAIGNSALSNNSTDERNTAVGAGALENNNARENTATGADALFGNRTGQFNTATGVDKLHGNHQGSNNTATGDAAVFQQRRRQHCHRRWCA